MKKLNTQAFTLMEMVIVLIIMGILTMAVMVFSGEQISRLQWKTVKDNISATYQDHYSQNLTSSSYAGKNYESMQLRLTTDEDRLKYHYLGNNGDSLFEETFTDRFVVSQLISDIEGLSPTAFSEVNISYSPYEISCHIGNSEASIEKIGIVFEIKEQKKYCFVIESKNCRLREVDCTNYPAWNKEF